MKAKPIESIHVAMPNTTALKMQSILELSKATAALAQALNSVNVMVEISNCHVISKKTGIQVSTE